MVLTKDLGVEVIIIRKMNFQKTLTEIAHVDVLHDPRD